MLSVEEAGDCVRICSLRAVVAAAFGTDPAMIPRVGFRFIENLDVVDGLEAQDPGQIGEGTLLVGLRLLWPLPLTAVFPLLPVFVVVLIFCGVTNSELQQ